MAIAILLIATSLLFIPSSSVLTHLLSQPQEPQAYTSILISEQGLDFVKSLLITKAISSAIPLHIPRIHRSIKFPFLGSVDVELSNITIYEIGVSSSLVKPGETGVSIIASGTTCNLSMDWEYDYFSWVFPFDVSDKGKATVQVEGMDIELTLGVENNQGTLNLNLMECSCSVKNISIKLVGGASWLYQGMINAFQEQIGSAVENAITKSLKEGICKLDSVLQSLPREIPVDDYASLNATFLNNPSLSNSSIGFDINGLFRAREKDPSHKLFSKNSLSSVICSDNLKMLGISLDEEVFNSASTLYYDAEFMHWIVDKIPDQSLLNTAGWRFIIPQLYKKYPNDDMNLNITLSSPPIIKISDHNIDATIYADLTIDVLHESRVIPVACISLVIRGSGSVSISGNNLTGNVKLNDFTMSQNWSEIGNLHLYLIQPVMRTLIQTVFMPFANTHLSNGFPLPVIHGFTLEDGEIICTESKITVCSDVSYSDTFVLNRSLIYSQ
ncbi:putative BPI/LBP family protein At1g04970 [Rutidosis leptorrhynchoides]|uniref:putative BPI/LBP family protein At1g04970 n=1 Tax=Rutidosis leptorrhynchoides TaxID=125765 RepID=UPI003A99E67C